MPGPPGLDTPASLLRARLSKPAHRMCPRPHRHRRRGGPQAVRSLDRELVPGASCRAAPDWGTAVRKAVWIGSARPCHPLCPAIAPSRQAGMFTVLRGELARSLALDEVEDVSSRGCFARGLDGVGGSAPQVALSGVAYMRPAIKGEFGAFGGQNRTADPGG